MHVLYYITGHGFGHGVRSCVICNEFSESVTLTIRSSLPAQFFSEELKRPFRYTEAGFDCGCVQKDGVTVDIEETLIKYAAFAERNRKIAGNEVDFIRQKRVDVIVSDITPFAFEMAHRANVPSFGVGNFSWADIYKPYTLDYPWFRPYLEQMCAQYHYADYLLCLQPSNEMSCFSRRHPVSLVARTGRERQKHIRAHFGIPPDKKLAMIYAGNYGMDSIDWKGLEQFEQWAFLGVYPFDPAPMNYHLVSKQIFPFQDLSASVDLVIGKIGYGLFGECLVHGVPLLYVPRTDFAEHSVLENAIQLRGAAYRLCRERFYSLDWHRELQDVVGRKRPQRYDAHGGKDCARFIEKHANV